MITIYFSNNTAALHIVTPIHYFSFKEGGLLVHEAWPEWGSTHFIGDDTGILVGRNSSSAYIIALGRRCQKMNINQMNTIYKYRK